VSKDQEAVGRVPGGKHLDKVLTQLGFKGNAELARRTGMGESSISKYRNGKAMPTSQSLDKIVSVIVETADDLDLYFDPVEFYVRFGLITREALQQEPVDEIFVELIRLDHETERFEFEHQLFRDQLQALMDLTQRRLEAARAETPRRRSAG
jgi:transcriptional regulator with XRE-family HTH domain